VQFLDLLPGHIILLVRAKGESLRDKERGAESVSLQDWPHDRVMRRDRIIERQDHQPVRNGLERARSRRSQAENQERREAETRPPFHARPGLPTVGCEAWKARS